MSTMPKAGSLLPSLALACLAAASSAPARAAIPTDVKFKAVLGTDGANKLKVPIWMGQIPGKEDAFLVADKGPLYDSARIWYFEKKTDGSWSKAVWLVLKVQTGDGNDERGLLGLAFHPDFVQNRKYYVSYILKAPGQSTDSSFIDLRMADPSFKKDAGTAPARILSLEQPYTNHNGGNIAFGPDGFLYIGFGDGGSQGDPENRGQNRSLLLGKMLRIDVGQTSQEEVDIVRKGENMGWSAYEGTSCYKAGQGCNGTATLPVKTFGRGEGRSITGGVVYRGNTTSPFYGVYICGDWETRTLWGIAQKDRVATETAVIAQAPDQPSSFAMDSKGLIYMIGYAGTIYQLDHTGLGPGPLSRADYGRAPAGRFRIKQEKGGLRVTLEGEVSRFSLFRLDGSLIWKCPAGSKQRSWLVDAPPGTYIVNYEESGAKHSVLLPIR